MRNPLSERIVEIPFSGIRKFFDIAAEMEDVISLGVGEPDFDTPWHIRDEGIYSLEKGRTSYTSNAGLKELKMEIAKYLERRFQVSYDYDTEMMITVGGSEAIDIAMRAMLDPGDEVLVPQPSYVSYGPCAKLADGVQVIINLKEEHNFRLTAQELEDAVTPRTKLLVLPFPNNPTGAIMEREDLEAISEVIKKHDLFVLSDEIYGELTYLEGQDHVTIASLPGMRERTVLINGFSKAYAMTGWRLGYLIVPERLVRPMQLVMQNCFISPNAAAQQAGIAALRHAGDEVIRMRGQYDERRRFVLKELRSMGFSIPVEPRGAFYTLINARHLSGDSLALAFDILEKAHVGVAPGIDFGSQAEGFLRLSYANSLENLAEAMRRLRVYVEEKRPSSPPSPPSCKTF